MSITVSDDNSKVQSSRIEQFVVKVIAESAVDQLTPADGMMLNFREPTV